MTKKIYLTYAIALMVGLTTNVAFCMTDDDEQGKERGATISVTQKEDDERQAEIAQTKEELAIVTELWNQAINSYVYLSSRFPHDPTNPNSNSSTVEVTERVYVYYGQKEQLEARLKELLDQQTEEA